MEGVPSAPIEEALESRSRLVSAPPQPVETSEPRPPSDPTIEVAAAEVSRTELEEIEEERAPSSSRRPITMETKMNELEDEAWESPAGDEAPPLHTPPPESGKLPAASPALELEAVHPELPARTEVAVFVASPRSELAEKSFGELLEDALSL